MEKKDNLKWLVLFSAMAIVGMSGYYSVFGISSLFAGKRLFAGIMAASLELGKLTTTTHLTRNWKAIGKTFRAYFIVSTVILVLISSAGIYSYLTDAYYLTAQKMKIVDTSLNSLTSEEQTLLEEKSDLMLDKTTVQHEMESLRSLVSDNEDRKADLYQAMNADTTGTINWNASIWKFNKDNGDYKENIASLKTEKTSATNRITSINDRLKEIWAESGTVQTSDDANDIGPLRKLAELFNADMDDVVKFFIFVLILVFDPLGVLLIVQFNKMILEENKEKPKKNSGITDERIYTHSEDRNEQGVIKVESEDLVKDEAMTKAINGLLRELETQQEETLQDEIEENCECEPPTQSRSLPIEKETDLHNHLERSQTEKEVDKFDVEEIIIPEVKVQQHPGINTAHKGVSIK